MCILLYTKGLRSVSFQYHLVSAHESIQEKNVNVVHSAGGQMNDKLAMYTTSSENQSLEEFSSGQK